MAGQEMLAAAFFAVSFVLGLIAVKWVAARNFKKGLIGIDINKPGLKKIPESTGLALLLPAWVCALAFFALFNDVNVLLWALMVSCFSLVGFFDDTKPKFISETRKWRYRALIIAVISLAFAALFFKKPEEIILASLFLAGIASFENTFAGLNGWEVGSGFILSAFFALLLWNTAYFPLAIALGGAILALLSCNAFPAKVFPGDSGTLLIGSGLAGLMVLTQDFRLMAVSFLFFIPHIIDFTAKLLTNPSDPSQRKALPYSLLPGQKIALPAKGKGSRKYDFAKILLKIFGPMGESRIVLLIWAILIANCCIVFVLLA
ncbi:MAG: hypothetical protein NT067_03155 [Candidatus Diapherotrites archaeon]|nr:hypothetical protein [Candidatus Diapherotrites archaeon]